MQLTQKELITVLKIALDAFQESLGVDVQALRIEALVAIVLDPGIYQRDMDAVLGVSIAAAHRNITKLTRHRQGPGFVEKRYTRDGRRFIWALHPTTEAQQWLDKLVVQIAQASGTEMTTQRLAVIVRHAMIAFREAVDVDVALYRMKLLLCILEAPGIAQADLATAARFESTGTSRNLANLSAFKQDKTPGPDLVDARIDPLSRKEHRLYPTAKATEWFAGTLKSINRKLLIR